LVYLGLRDVEPQEIELLKTLGIRAFYMSDVRRLGIDAVIREINEFVGEAPVHVSLDVDGIDPEHTGATGTPVPDGLSMEETQSVLRSLRARRWISLDIVEVNLQEGSPEVQALTLDCSLSLISTFLS
jgi:arginase